MDNFNGNTCTMWPEKQMLWWSNTTDPEVKMSSYCRNDNCNNDVITRNIVVFKMIYVKLEFFLINIFVLQWVDN